MMLGNDDRYGQNSAKWLPSCHSWLSDKSVRCSLFESNLKPGHSAHSQGAMKAQRNPVDNVQTLRELRAVVALS